MLILAAAGLLCFEQYFLRAGTSRKAMFYYAAPQTLMGRYAATRVPDHPVYVLYSEEPETLQFLTFARRRWVVLENDPARLDLEKIRPVRPQLEFVVENHPRFAELLRSLRTAFPEAKAGFLADMRHPAEPKIATILSVLPGPGPLPEPSSPAPGGPPGSSKGFPGP